MKFVRTTLFNAQNAAGNLASSAIDGDQLISMSLQAIATGTIAGTIKLQFSNDAPSNLSGPTNWSDITSASVAVSGAEVVAIMKTDISYRWIRATYTATSGAGNLTINVMSLSI